MKKLKIEKLKVKSFVTGIEETNSETVKGGAGGTTLDGKNPCLTILTRGYWTRCCGDSGHLC